jgi:hypothetical protein
VPGPPRRGRRLAAPCPPRAHGRGQRADRGPRVAQLYVRQRRGGVARDAARRRQDPDRRHDDPEVLLPGRARRSPPAQPLRVGDPGSSDARGEQAGLRGGAREGVRLRAAPRAAPVGRRVRPGSLQTGERHPRPSGGRLRAQAPGGGRGGEHPGGGSVRAHRRGGVRHRAARHPDRQRRRLRRAPPRRGREDRVPGGRGDDPRDDQHRDRHAAGCGAHEPRGARGVGGQGALRGEEDRTQPRVPCGNGGGTAGRGGGEGGFCCESPDSPASSSCRSPSASEDHPPPLSTSARRPPGPHSACPSWLRRP